MTVAALVAAGVLAVQPGAPQSGGVRPNITRPNVTRPDVDQAFDVRAGPAVQSINRLAAQAGIDVVVAADLARRRTPALRGRMSAAVALDRLLRPLGLRAVRIGAGMYRIEATPARPRVAPAPPPSLADLPPTQLSEVVVTAVPPVGTGSGAGRALIDTGALTRAEGLAASDAIADLTATVDSTRQGAGRNKLFVRGLADSAMNGPLQATVGQYLGDLRLSYGSPDPDLALVDIRRIEVFEGPQGARFGVGAIGGIVRLVPQAPVLGESAGRLVAGVGATSGGGASGDAALVLNQALGERMAGRIVAYARRDGGFLDDPMPGARETDHTETLGGRAALRWTDAAWTLDLTALAQRVAAGDAQTIAVSETRSVTAGAVREPYESTVALAGLTARRRIGDVRLTSATSISRQRLDERFDASRPADDVARVVDRRQTAVNASSELRIDTDPLDGWTWSAGAALAVGETRVERRQRDLSPDSGPGYGADLKRAFAEATAFGEGSLAPAPNWRVAIGARLSAVRIDTDIRTIETTARAASDRNGVAVRLTPSLSARWDPNPAATVFARFERAVRPAGVSEASGAFERYQGDRVTLTEIGVRSRDWREDLSGELSVGWVDWRDVQADIVTQGGDLVTDNVGDGVIRFVSLKAAWTPTQDLAVSGGLFVNENRLTPTRFSIIGAGRGDIPNVAPVGAQLSLDYTAGRLAGAPLRLGADLRYVGQSRLGVGPGLDVPQGGYLRTELTARLGDDRRAWTLRVSNPLDAAGIRYGIGSPYQLSQPQAVPVRPLTVRLSFDAAF